MLSSSLLTADYARHITHVNDDELQLQREQYRASQALAASDEPLVIYDAQGKEYQVKIALKVATLNVGVNLLSLNPVVAAALSSWSQADKYTEEGLTTLAGSLNP